MNDIIPPKRPLSDIQRPRQASVPASKQPETLPKPLEKHDMPLLDEPQAQSLLLDKSKKSRAKKIMLWSLGLFTLGLIVAAIGLYSWYTAALAPVNAGATEKARVQIASGSSPSAIGVLLEEKGLIKNRIAFDIYTRLSDTRSKLQAGVYNLSASESTPEIVTHLVSGNTDTFSITFLPGATLAEHKKVFIKAGYSDEEVSAAFAKTYDHPLFATKSASSDLEGYIYGETYSFAGNATVEQILTRTFDYFYGVVQKNNLVASYRAQGLTLYEGITLASIIQREVPGAQDQKQVAQIFLTRLAMGMQLGSDVTAYYGADKLGVERSVAVDTPYNTRLHIGMPPGPIGTPGLSALQAVATPANGDYVYFLSGDDEVTYFARTDSEHEANIRNHCAVKCSIP